VDAMRVLLWVVYGWLLSVPAWADDPIGKGVTDLIIFDAHMHYKEPAWEPYPPDTVLKLMDKTGVAMALVSSTPDDGTIRLWEYAPKRIVPEIRPYHDQWGSGNWTRAPDMFEYILGRLDKYPHTGIGEFHLHRVDMKDAPLLSQIAKVAFERDLYIHVHSGSEPVEFLYSLQSGLKVIWAHAGMSEPAEEVERMMGSYETLYADTSYRETDILRPGNTIDPAWRRVLMTYWDRFMVGTDTWVNAQWAEYEAIVQINRQWISHFPQKQAEAFAYKNAQRLFGRQVSQNLIGTRK